MIDLPTESEPVQVVEGDCLAVMPSIPPGSVDAIVSDPPYGLEFMGKGWDSHGVPGEWYWRTAKDTLKPGGYAVVFGGTRTYHRLTCAVEDAGFEIRDCLLWLYGTGFPKGAGCLKPAYEPILLARRPGPRVLPLGIDECRVPTSDNGVRTVNGAMLGTVSDDSWDNEKRRGEPWAYNVAGRYPANVVHDGSDEVLEAFAAFGERPAKRGPDSAATGRESRRGVCYQPGLERVGAAHGDTGTAARFFYCAKASRAERGPDNRHPTVKPLSLMRWLVRLVAPAGSLVLDPFGGSGTTGVACRELGRRCLLIERESAYCEIARKRVAEAVAGQGLFAGAVG